uniref:G-protein coupled receptors family 1 profile domain-containing protein n=1 Tax=Sinocyclocheilus rhinocerous TaxID=307959 RepID=A0A673LTZ4_9TELE
MQSNSSANVTFVCPATFFLIGFSNIPHVKYYFVFLSLVYVVTVLANSFIMFIIYLACKLHTAKYIAVFHLALSDLCGSSAVIPKVIDTFLFEHQDISYEACLNLLFFILHFTPNMNMQSLTLLVLAYDRLVAICFPLRYHAIVTKPAMFLIIGVIWIFSVTFFSVLVGSVNRLSFCGSNVLDSYFCDYGPIYRIACNDNSLNILLGKICYSLLIFTPLILIFISYFCIALVLFKIPHGVDRIKAIKTCTSHLLIINNSLTQTIPPMLNPIIYTLKTEEVMQSIKELYKRSKVNTSTEIRVKCSRRILKQ